MIVVGIDLGLQGAIAGLAPDGLRLLESMPTGSIAIGKRTRGTYNLGGLCRLLAMLAPDLVVCEDVYRIGYKGSLAARSMGLVEAG